MATPMPKEYSILGERPPLYQCSFYLERPLSVLSLLVGYGKVVFLLLVENLTKWAAKQASSLSRLQFSFVVTASLKEAVVWAVQFMLRLRKNMAYSALYFYTVVRFVELFYCF